MAQLATLDTDDAFVFPHDDALPAWHRRVTDHPAWLAQMRTAIPATRGTTP